jgi:hypothetical protein
LLLDIEEFAARSKFITPRLSSRIARRIFIAGCLDYEFALLDDALSSAIEFFAISY